MEKKLILIMSTFILVIAGCNNQNKQEQKSVEMNTEIPKISDFPVGKENTGYAQYFSGKSWLAPPYTYE